ncbi:MAG TPA: glycoside hydrolase family 28 protein [Candidatus Sulfotelmatobacter sp.]|nr:glycoside hydrolase family 28 protein [Candidatus Sulfotelmatobacter sp.]
MPGNSLAAAPAGAATNPIFQVTSFGAQGDGKALDSPAINKAIEAAEAAGGGTVFLPAGCYRCFSIRLKSNVALYLAPGSILLASDPAEEGAPGYDLAESNQPWENYQDFGHNHWHNSLLWGEGLTGVSISGPGLIWGKGLSRGWGAGPKAEQPGVANKAIALKNCRNVLLRDFSILHGGHFGILATGVDNLTIDNLLIDTNRDGMDIDCCRNVRISNCSVNSPWDDGICLKSSFALGYARATEMVTISNCLVAGSYQEGTLLDATCKLLPPDEKAYRTGRIKFGTESNGGFKNITVSNCVFEGCHGFAIESVDGAVIEDVTITNITMRNVLAAPIFVRLGARMRGPESVPVGVIRRLNISNVTCLSAAAPPVCSIISGIPGHPMEDLKLSDITILHQGGGTHADAALQIFEKEKDYPEPTMFGTTPAHGFFIRHVKGIELSGIKIESATEDARPAFSLYDVQDADLRHIKMSVAPGVPAFVLNDVTNFSVFRSKPVPDLEVKSAKRQEL